MNNNLPVNEKKIVLFWGLRDFFGKTHFDFLFLRKKFQRNFIVVAENHLVFFAPDRGRTSKKGHFFYKYVTSMKSKSQKNIYLFRSQDDFEIRIEWIMPRKELSAG